jgi:DNA-binding SARP family transcriptional activator/pimeloyl-ACP methyl ester carboxylesterase
MEFCVLGPLEAVVDGRALALGGTRQRALLARLLLDNGRTIGVDRLVDDLWGDPPPDTARKMIQVYVSRLRKLLPDDTLHTRASGYEVTIPPDSLDLERFETHRAAGRAALEYGDHERAANELRSALALWRGPALAEFTDEPFAQTEAARLDALRSAAVEERIQADLELGNAADVIPELETLIAHHPLREQLRAKLMLALYRAGRQADALAVYHDARRVLEDELGIQPSETLRDLERRILQHDPTLDMPAQRETQRVEPIRVPVRRPVVRYARSGELNIAYQVVGDGPIDVVLVSGFVSHLEKDWEEPRYAHFLERLASISRLILFDKRGTGLSDRPRDLPDLETRMDDVRAVMDAAGSERAVLFGHSEGAPMALLFSATYPDRARALMLFGAYAKRLDPDGDYPWAPTREARAAYADDVERDWGFESDMKLMCPSADEAMARWWGERCRAAASPGAVKALIEMNSLIDVRALLPAIHVPTLVVHRGTDFDVKVEEGRYISERIEGARFVELPGADHFVAVDAGQVLDVVEPFLAECGAAALPAHDDRVLVTLLVTDIAGSTRRAAEIGDSAWHHLVERHYELIRTELARYHGREIDSAGDGILAAFDGPARAVRCASAVAAAVRSLGLELRAGVHTGEVELAEGRMRGIAVHIAARVASQAAPGEVVVSQTVKDLVAGSGLEFADRGSRTLDGVPGEWRLHAVVDPIRSPVTTS